jgi:hypothetical protein
MANTFASELIGDVDAAAADFKGLTEHLESVAKQLPPSHVIPLNEIGSVLGAVIAFIEHGDKIVSAAAHGALYTAATLGRKDVAEVQAGIAGDLQTELSALLARAKAAGIDLAAAAAPAAPTAAPTSAGTTPALTTEQLAQIATVIGASS